MTKKITQLTRASLAALIASAGIASAQAEGLYVGGALGTPDYHGSINGVSGNGSGLGAKAFGGYQLTPNIAFEAGLYDLGHIDNGSGKVTTRGLYIDAIGSVALAPRWSLLGSAGLTQARLRTTYGNDSSPGLKLGVGVQYDLTQNLALRAQYERYRFTNAFDDKADVGAASVGVKWGF